MKKKENNEVTVKIKGDIQTVCKNLESKDFRIVDEFTLNDTYFIPKDLKIEKMTEREILAKAILIRNIRRKNPDRIVKVLTFKKKEIDENGNILSQEKAEVGVEDLEDAKKFLSVIGYKEIIRIKEKDITYERDGFKVSLKDIENGDKLIETDIVLENDRLNTVEKLNKKFEEYEIPIYTDNYFVKKAEVELKKVLGR